MKRVRAILSQLFKTKIRAFITLFILAVICIGLFQILKPKTVRQQVQTAEVTRGNLIATLSESGNVSAGTQASVTSPTDGIITEVYVKNGDNVDVGQNLFTVKSTATPQEQASAYASFLSSQNNLNAAKAKMNALQSALFKANQAFINDKGIDNPSDAQKADPKYIEENADWLQAESDYSNQAGVIAQAEAAYNSAALAYQATQNAVVTAPIEGTVANFSSGVGSSVTSGGSGNASSSTASSNTASTGSSAVLVIGNFSNLLVKVAVSEVDIPKIKGGEKATVTLDAFPDQTFVGTVTSIDTLGTTSSGVVTYAVYITLVSPPSSIRSGMSASAAIQTARRDDVLMVPTAAVQTVNGQSFVRVQKNGSVTQVPVETGISSDTETEIISGVAEGDTVVTNTLTIGTPGGAGASGTSPFGGFGGGRGFGGGGGAVFFRGGAGGGRGG